MVSGVSGRCVGVYNGVGVGVYSGVSGVNVFRVDSGGCAIGSVGMCVQGSVVCECRGQWGVCTALSEGMSGVFWGSWPWSGVEFLKQVVCPQGQIPLSSVSS